MNPQFTPWSYSGVIGDDFVLGRVNGHERIKIATVHVPEMLPLIAAAPDLCEALKQTGDLALELMERAEKIDEMLAKASGSIREVELGQIARMRSQLNRNAMALNKAGAR